ncbi:MAG: phosphoglucomutase/phosphomannomutase family protein [Candidatus Omnitrophica bacterium]|nr:phosphoglucomutase/phosphomannomutase family protein [Candidatus Omnitrophota bacterium]MDD5311105.1 phosphoglucomutase/phosphomannomutase family protein [Candidatus Omnitrophota bacterium]
MSIKFGTSGWRAVIADGFTFSNVRKAAQAIAGYVKAHHPSRKAPPVVIIGHDTRFDSREFASAAAKVLCANGVKVLLTERDTPTPVISFQVVHKEADGAINITASHNPPEYNGLKFSPSHGGPAEPEVTKEIEKRAAKIKGEVEEPLPSELKCRIEEFDPRRAYFARIKDLVDLSAIKKARLKAVVDVMHGTGRGYLDRILTENGCKVILLNDNLDPLFGGHPPEPAKDNIGKMLREVKRHKADLGLGLDGDADRFGIVDENGRFYTPDEVISLLFKHLIDTRPRLPKVARTHSTTRLVDRIAARYGIEVVETPIGFKYIGEVLMTGECIIGGEESGGLSIANHVPEKDGILACLLVAEMVAVRGKKLSAILNEIYREFGRSYPGKLNVRLTDDQKARLLHMLKSRPPKEIAGTKVAKLDTMDGYKFTLADSSWVLVRPSGTEPLIRFHFEAMTAAKEKKLIKYCEDLIHAIKTQVNEVHPPEED